MSNENTKKANSALLGATEPVVPKAAEKKFGGAKAAKPTAATKAPVTEEEDKKHAFSSTITTENKRRFANYQANKPGRKGTATTDVLNAALAMFFDANTKYADKDPDNDE
ncbi:hypothetical protein [Hymenobacter sp. YC55]|uniref:hypothetical protein n=1 Tax=Hymenobacter sp. YC55 TaxID=3034019 RepID=UPI0023F69B2F|nr:hypothetical protein [Hymenobacter sp. YC55]MDF7815307.1 hypothetical protein [Hymenobacter sp. YC55]